MAEKQHPRSAPIADKSDHLSDSDESNKVKVPSREPKQAATAAAARSDPDFEDKIELKYEDCPEKTGFAYPSYVKMPSHSDRIGKVIED